jgi:para-nitrobenzyl esterase
MSKHTPRHLGLLTLATCCLLGCPDDAPSDPTTPGADAADAGSGADASPSTDADLPDTRDAERDAHEPDADASNPGACPGEADPAAGVVLTRDGALQGALDDGVWSFKGVPFAAPPTGELRWRPPRPHGCHDASPRPATSFGPACPQLDEGSPVGDEDCLTLNVWTTDPAPSADPRPVVVFIHGGANILGSAGQELAPGRAIYDGARFARDHGVVLVTLQYRLGPLGFLAHPDLTAESDDASSGTYGHLDQIAALEWVRDDIAAFGGDPDRVMIFGESAGAVNTCTLMASPLARGLFDAALMQSGGCPSTPLATAQAEGAAAAGTIAACEGADDLLACLRALPASDLVAAIPGAFGFVGGDQPEEQRVDFAPVSGTPLLPRDTWDLIADGEHNRVRLVVGSNAEEGASQTIFPIQVRTAQQYATFVRTWGAAFGPGAADRILALYPAEDYDTPQDAAIQVYTDAAFTCSARRLARSASPHADIYRYFFTRRAQTRQGELPARHGIELLHVFGTLSDIPLFTPVEADLALSQDMMTRWAAFASGAPNYPAGLTWEAYDPARDNHLDFGATVTAAQDLRTTKCDLWDDLLGVD